MPNIFLKNFYLCFSNSKSISPTLPPPSPTHRTTTSPSTCISLSDDFFSSSAEFSTGCPPDFAAVFTSQRFFFSSPGYSNSIVESTDSPSKSGTIVAAGGIAVQTDSPDPYLDFRRSMQEMVEARELVELETDWDYLHELLLCYLTLNPKHTHKYVIRAFSDLLVSLTLSTTTEDRLPKPELRQRSSVSQRFL